MGLVAGYKDVALLAGIPARDCERVMEAIVLLLSRGRRVKLWGFGEFGLCRTKARQFDTSMIPGGKAIIPERVRPTFRMARAVREAIHKGVRGRAYRAVRKR